MYKALLYLFILFIFVLSACGNDEERLLTNSNNVEDNSAGKEQATNIIFGTKVSDTELKAGNIFELGETTHFVVTADKPFNVKQVQITLSKLKNNKWVNISQAPLPVNPEATQFLNGLPGELYKKTGPGAYQLAVYAGDKEIARGEFIVEEKKQ